MQHMKRSEQKRDRMSSILSNSRFRNALGDFKFGPTWMNKAEPAEPEKPMLKNIIWALPMLALLWRLSPLLYTEGDPQLFDPCVEFSSPSDACKFKIPRIIHQTYKTKELPDQWAESPEMWKATHPKWKYMFWTDEQNRDLIATHYSWFLKQYDSYPNGIQRADAVRYFILYHYGGVYADFDVQPLRSIEPMLMGSECMVGETPNIGITNAFMAATAKSSFYFYVMTQLTPNAHPLMGTISRHWEILQSTGPTFLWKIMSQYNKKKSSDGERKQRVDVVPSYVWGKCLICDRVCVTRDEGAYFQHATGDSWHHWDSYIFTYVLMCHKEFFLLLVITGGISCYYKPVVTKQLLGYYGAMLILLLL